MERRNRQVIAMATVLGLALGGTGAAACAAPEQRTARTKAGAADRRAAADWRTVPHPSAEGTLRDAVVVGGQGAWAVGDRHPPNGTATPVTQRWDGSSWREVPVPGTPTGTGTLDGVSATAPNDVWAVGDSTGKGPVIRHWNGSAWSAVRPAPPPRGEHAGADRLYDVTAVSRNLAWAVGSFSDWDAPGAVPLIERWNGRTWTRMPVPTSGNGSHRLESVAAVSATDAWAVGWYVDGDRNVPLALHWNGRAWTTSALTPPAGSTELHGVTAASKRSVWAVGRNEGKPVVMHWNGRSWRPLPHPPVTDARLRAAAPHGRGGVWVAGWHMTNDGTVSRPLFLRWDGGRWHTGTSDQPEGAVRALAPAGTRVWAVGTTSPCECYVAPTLLQATG